MRAAHTTPDNGAAREARETASLSDEHAVLLEQLQARLRRLMTFHITLNCYEPADKISGGYIIK